MLNLIVIAAFALVLPALGWLLQKRGSRADALRYPPPGNRVSVGTHRLHYRTRGKQGPVVVFDAALAASSVSWSLVEPLVAEFARTFVYDRAGSGWSEPGPFPRNLTRITNELKALLEAARVPPPYVLVGHSYGGLTARHFASCYPGEVSGLVLIDTADVDQWSTPAQTDRRKLLAGARLARRGANLALFGVPRAVVCLGRWGALDAAQKLAGALGGGMKRPTQDRLIAPMFKLPQPQRRLLHWFWTEPAFYKALASQIDEVPDAARLVAESELPSQLPLAVVAADNGEPEWLLGQRALTHLTENGRFFLAEGSGHWIPLDRPDVVAEGIRFVVRQFELSCAGGPQRPPTP